MKTYQDLIKVGQSDVERAKFCEDAIRSFMASQGYKDAQIAEAYYSKHNVTIEKYQKTLTTLSGQVKADIFSSNYKLKTLMFRRFVTQQVQYLLGNGMTLDDSKNKEKLGKRFDFLLQKALKKAMVQGKAFGFWNLDHMEVFGYADTANEAGFCPLYDENTAELRAGIRFYFKKVNEKKTLVCTLYEEDGYTEYRIFDKDVVVEQDKRAYKLIVSKVGEVEEITAQENYSSLPIIPLYASDTHESELVGCRENIDCYDFIKSGLANDIDDMSGFFWVLENTGGMNGDEDLARFVQRMKQVHAASIDADAGSKVDAHTMDVPVDSRAKMLEILRSDLYEDFQAVDIKSLSAAQKTTQEIQAAYQPQDNKVDDIEYLVIDFVQQIMALAGIDDNPSFVRSKVLNQPELTQMILSASEYLTDEMIIKKLPFLTPEEADQVIAQRNGEDFDNFNDDSITIGGERNNMLELMNAMAGLGDKGVDAVKEFLKQKEDK